jgi:hypothetical protein
VPISEVRPRQPHDVSLACGSQPAHEKLLNRRIRVGALTTAPNCGSCGSPRTIMDAGLFRQTSLPWSSGWGRAVDAIGYLTAAPSEWRKRMNLVRV